MFTKFVGDSMIQVLKRGSSGIQAGCPRLDSGHTQTYKGVAMFTLCLFTSLPASPQASGLKASVANVTFKLAPERPR